MKKLIIASALAMSFIAAPVWANEEATTEAAAPQQVAANEQANAEPMKLASAEKTTKKKKCGCHKTKGCKAKHKKATA